MKMRFNQYVAMFTFLALGCTLAQASDGLSIEKRVQLINAFGKCDGTKSFTTLPSAVLVKGLAITIDQTVLDESLRRNLSPANYRDAKARLEIYLEAAKKTTSVEDAAVLKNAYLDGYKCVLQVVKGDKELEDKMLYYISEADTFLNDLGTSVTPNEYMMSAAAFEVEVMKDIIQHYYMTEPKIRRATDATVQSQEKRGKNVMNFLNSNIADTLLGR